ncbi:MAG: type II 3-dehydroquinate dehydratase [Chitinophagia bacterium]|nr:type II 3-dehydroquinate dehydratase [Chitinophagia bacterium]
MLRISVINGPNLNLLGSREPAIYGHDTLETIIDGLTIRFPQVTITAYQSNVEGELINHLHHCMGHTDGVVINPGGYAHTSIALADAISAIGLPVVEVHLSNIYAREGYRHQSFTAGRCIGCITGLGKEGYALAVQYLMARLAPETP